MPTRMITFLLLLVVIGSLPSCTSTVPPTITRTPQVALRGDAPVFLIAKRQRERVAQSLTRAGIELSNRLEDDSYTLIVKIGRGRGVSSCGVTANVAYILRSSYGRNIMVIKGRGRTGDCTPNMLDDMSRRLAATMGK